MSGGLSCRNIRITEFPETSFQVIQSSSKQFKQSGIVSQHVTLTQASRTSTTSACGAFAGGGETKKEKYRVVVMGSAFVGKTQIVSQFLYDKFSSRYRQTIEELHRGEYQTPDQNSLTLDILDTSGAFAFPAMRDLSINTSNGFILVFSIDNEESWKEVTRLREKIIEKRGPRIPIVVVANKIDKEWTLDMARENVETIVKIDWECGFVDCSAKDNSNIIKIFKELLVQSSIRYNLSPAVRRRRQSLPVLASTSSNSPKFSLKRHSCSVS